MKTLERDQQQAKTKGDLTHLWSREKVSKRDQPENGLDVSIDNKDYKVLVIGYKCVKGKGGYIERLDGDLIREMGPIKERVKWKF